MRPPNCVRSSRHERHDGYFDCPGAPDAGNLRDHAWPQRVPCRSSVVRLSGIATGEPSRSVYGVAKIDNRGRVAHAAVERALGWAPGTRLSIHEVRGVILVYVDERGIFEMSTQGHVYLPLPVRRWCPSRHQ